MLNFNIEKRYFLFFLIRKYGSSILEDGLVSQILGKRVNEVDPDKHYYLYKCGSSIKVVEAG